MAGVARSVDEFLGAISRFLHFRSARLNTASDMGQYLSATTEELFPRPSAPTDVTRRKVLRLPGADRVTVDLEWRSQHVPICPSYRVRHAVDYPLNQTAIAAAIPTPILPCWVRASQPSSMSTAGSSRARGSSASSSSRASTTSSTPTCSTWSSPSTAAGTRSRPSSTVSSSGRETSSARSRRSASRASTLRTLVAWQHESPGQYRREDVFTPSRASAWAGRSQMMLPSCLDPDAELASWFRSSRHLPYLSSALGRRVRIFFCMRSDLEKFGDRPRSPEARSSTASGPPAPPSRPAAPEPAALDRARDDAYITAPVVERQWRAWGEPPIESGSP